MTPAVGSSEAARFGVAVHAYVRAVAGAMSSVVRTGPFTALLSRVSPEPSWNYAIPDDFAVPTDAEVNALAAVFRSRGLQPRVEMVPPAAPEVAASLLSAGFQLTEELPLMACDQQSLVPLEPPSGIVIRRPESTEELRAMAELQREVFGDSGPLTDEFIAERRRQQESGGILRVAQTGDGVPIAAGMCPPVHAGLCEIVGVATLPQWRRRGIAGAITAALTAEAFAAGCAYVYLEAAPGADGAYRRAGYRSLASVAHYAG